MLKRRSKSALHRSAIHRAALVEPLERRILLSGTITAVQGQNFNVGDLDGEGAIGPYVYYPYSGTIQIPAGASVSATQVRADGLTVSGNLSMTFAGAGIMDTSHVSVLNWLSMPTDNNGNYLGTLDLSNNALIIRANGNTYAQQAAILAPIEAAIAHAYGTTSPHWTGTGITTTATDTYSGTTAANVAIADFVNNTTRSDTGSPTPILNQLGNVPLALNDIVLAFTVVGDANLSGTVNYTDMQLLMAHYNSTTGMTWYQGDFNYTGSVNYTDYQLLSSNYNFHLPVSTAPEVGLTPPAFVDQFSTLVPPDSLSATVDFGDGSGPTPAAIFASGGGTFDVFADHTYSQSGTDVATTTINGTTTSISDADQAYVVGSQPELTPASSLTANFVSPNETDLAWTDNSGGAATYEVDQESAGVWTIIGVTNPGANSFTATGPFSASTSYNFAVYNDGDPQISSNAAPLTTSPFPAVTATIDPVTGAMIGTPITITANATPSYPGDPLTYDWSVTDDGSDDPDMTGFTPDGSTLTFTPENIDSSWSAQLTVTDTATGLSTSTTTGPFDVTQAMPSDLSGYVDALAPYDIEYYSDVNSFTLQWGYSSPAYDGFNILYSSSENGPFVTSRNYDPTPSPTGSYSYTYQGPWQPQTIYFEIQALASSPNLSATTQPLSVTVPEYAPVADDYLFGTALENESERIGLPVSPYEAGIQNPFGYDVDGLAITPSVQSQPPNGIASWVPDGYNGYFEYTPNSGFVGTDSFTYIENDGTLESAPGTVDVTVWPYNPQFSGEEERPVGTTTEDTPVTITLDGSQAGYPEVAANAAQNGTLQYQSSQGSGNQYSATYIYTPNPGFFGYDNITYNYAPGSQYTETASVAVNNSDVQIISYEAGSNFSQMATVAQLQNGSPSDFVVPVDTDVVVNGSETDNGYQTLPQNTADQNLAGISLVNEFGNAYPGDSMQLILSNDSDVRLFKVSTGALFYDYNETGTGALSNLSGSSILSIISSGGEPNFMLEALKSDPDFVMTFEYLGPSGQVLSSDSLHMDLVNPQINAATIQDNVAGSPISEADKISEGAFVPVDDGDFDYDNAPDDQQVDQNGNALPPPPGDDRLLPIYLSTTNDNNAADYYNLTVAPGTGSGDIRIFSQAQAGGTYTLVTASTQIPVQNTPNLFVEGYLSPGQATIDLNFTSNGITYMDVDRLKVTVFEMSGPLNVPGNGEYNYTATATNQANGDNLLPDGSGWLAPFEKQATGTSAGTLSDDDDNTTNADITWNNSAVVGELPFQVNDDYQWDMDVNVVQIIISTAAGSNAINLYQGAKQHAIEYIDSSNQPWAMAAQLTVASITGPMSPNGQTMLGISHLELGFIQLAQITEQYADFANVGPPGQRIQNNYMGQNYYLDQITDTGQNESDYPWYDSDPNNPYGPGSAAQFVNFESLKNQGNQPVPNQGFQIADTPNVPATVSGQLLTPAGAIGGITSFGILLNFQDYFAVRTTDTENNANSNYVDLASANWIFNGSGQVIKSQTGMIDTWTSNDAAHENTTDGTHTTGTFTLAAPGTPVPLPSGFEGDTTPVNILEGNDNAHNWVQVPIPAGG